MGLTYEVAKFIVEKGYGDFSEKDISGAKDIIIDAIGAMITGLREPVSQKTAKYIKESGGIEECGVIGGAFRSSLTNCALLNGTSVHASELEAIGPYTGSNPMTNIPVALSVAEKCALSGRSVLEGVIIGLEVQTKLGMSGPGSFDKGFSSIPLYGSLGAAATACKMMQLNIEQVQNALGIAIAQCGGQNRQTGTMTHLLENGIGCRNGVTAALLAKEGVTADANLLEGERGFYDLFCSSGRGYDIEAPLRSLGNPFSVTFPGIFIKKYGCCFFSHKAMDAMLELMDKHRFVYDEVDHVRAEIPTFVARVLRYPEPVNCEEAKFSLEQGLGALLIDGKVELPYIRPFTDAGFNDAKYKNARNKIKVITRTDWDGGRSVPWSIPITVKLRDGRQYENSVENVKGGPQNPLSKQELISRYDALSRGFLSQGQINRSAELVYSLENLDNVLELLNLNTFGMAK